MNQYKNLLEGDIKKSLMSMTNSISLGFISLFTFNIIDTFFISMLGSKQLSAIGFAFPVIFLWMNIFFGINTGITSQVGKALGKDNIEQAKTLTLNSIILIIILSLFISLVGYSTTDATFRFMGADHTIMDYIKDYLDIWYCGFIFLALLMGMGAAIRGSGDAKTPSRIMVYSGILNGILDPIFIFGLGPIPRLEITGAMIATVISWAFAFILCLYNIFTKIKLLEKYQLKYTNFITCITTNFIPNAKDILNVGLPSALSNIISPFASIVILKIVAYNGYASIAGFGVGMRLEALAFIFTVSLSIAIVPFVSINHGARNYLRITNGLKYAIKMTFIIQMLIYLSLFLLSSTIANIFSEDPDVINIIILYLQIIPGGYCFVGMIMLILSTLNAIEHAKYSTLINFIRFFIFSIPCVYIGNNLYGITGILLGMILAKILAFLVAITVFKKVASIHFS